MLYMSAARTVPIVFAAAARPSGSSQHSAGDGVLVRSSPRQGRLPSTPADANFCQERIRYDARHLLSMRHVRQNGEVLTTRTSRSRARGRRQARGHGRDMSLARMVPVAWRRGFRSGRLVRVIDPRTSARSTSRQSSTPSKIPPRVLARSRTRLRRRSEIGRYPGPRLRLPDAPHRVSADVPCPTPELETRNPQVEHSSKPCAPGVHVLTCRWSWSVSVKRKTP